MVPGQRAGSGKAAAGFRSPRPSAAGLEGGTRTGFCVMVLGTGGAASGSRDPRLVTGRPSGTGCDWRGAG